MSLSLTWQAAALRLVLTLVAGALIGINRGERGHAAGLRTTMVVALAACLAMLQVNALLALDGKSSSSFIVMDLMRLPLGILSGMGFIGAGAIVRRGSAIRGVTTAATLWLMTVIGLCFGGGQIALGAVGTGAGGLVLWLLKRVDLKLPRDRYATLAVVSKAGQDLNDAIGRALSRARLEATYDSGTYGQDQVEVRYVVHWRGSPIAGEPSEMLAELSAQPGVRCVQWNVERSDVEERT
jgi:putative Mg2+ transporter-C (MgtC) family protein